MAKPRDSGKQDDGTLLPEVKRYLEAEQRIQEFRRENYEFFVLYDELRETLARTRQAAEKAVRLSGVSSGPFRRTSRVRQVNIENALNLLGEERFLQIGGTVSREVVYSLSVESLDFALSEAKLTKEEYDELISYSNRFSMPKDIL